MDCETRKKPNIGGQALIEGLLMIGPKNGAMAVRKTDGEIAVEIMSLPVKDLPARIPVIRGMVIFFRQLVLGTKAVMQSVQYVDIDEQASAPSPVPISGTEVKPVIESQSKHEPYIESQLKHEPYIESQLKHEPKSKFVSLLNSIFGEKLIDKVREAFNPTVDGKLKNTFIYVSVVISLIFSIGLFVLLPNVIAGFLNFDKETILGIFSYNLYEGLFRITIFFGYLIAVSNLNDIKRVWQYHGAEHKTIHCYEHDEPLTVENIRKYTTKHPRCGTSFLFLVLVVSVIVFSFLGWHSVIINILSRLILIPFVAGLSYELLKLAGRSKGIVAAVINAPGLAFQRFTTKEPDDSQIEVAIAAFNNLEMDGDAA